VIREGFFAKGNGLLVTVKIGPALPAKQKMKPKVSALPEGQVALQVIDDKLIQFGTRDHRRRLLFTRERNLADNC
jgi:hypothetical protein